jgi:hypothetical protein
MSWSLSTVGLAADIESRIDALEPPCGDISERDVQVKAAKEAAKAMIASGTLGAPEGFAVAMTGHANPGNEKGDEGMYLDFLNVAVQQAPASAVEEYDARMAAKEAPHAV